MVNNLRRLSRNECLDLLAGEHFGRISVSIGALPAVLPMTYALVDGQIVVRTAAGTKLTAALVDRGVVGFEVDSGRDDTNAWSVLVFGQASEILEDHTLDRVGRLLPRSWATDGRDHFVAISVEQISGRSVDSRTDRESDS
jgi:nitroimidazol reductase NimA-like FMN-containing flavoprotein (pyridoxamine 5'-phosphate oxidase superfamily)